MKISQLHVDILAQALANGEDLLIEVLETVNLNEISLSNKEVEGLVYSFTKIGIRYRTSPYFNHVEFVNQHLKVD